ncbi:MAG: protein-disulfide reductase DsbD domain-containing protein [Planctomycetota bacterium]
MELQSNYESIKALDTEIIAVAQEETDPKTLAKIKDFVNNEFPVVADPERATWKTFSRYGIYLVDKEGVIRIAADGNKEARPRLDLVMEELAALEGGDAPEVQFGGVREANASGAKVSAAEDALGSRWMWSHNFVRPGDEFKLALLPMIADGYHVYASQESEMIPFRVEVELQAGVEMTAPVAYPRGRKYEDAVLEGTYSIYEGDIPMGALRFKLQEDVEPGELLVKVTLHFQACDDSSCFAPASKTISVPLTVKAKSERRQQVFGWNTW